MIRQLGMKLHWHPHIGGTKKGLATLCQAVELLNEKQAEIITELNKLLKEKNSE